MEQNASKTVFFLKINIRTEMFVRRELQTTNGCNPSCMEQKF